MSADSEALLAQARELGALQMIATIAAITASAMTTPATIFGNGIRGVFRVGVTRARSRTKANGCRASRKRTTIRSSGTFGKVPDSVRQVGEGPQGRPSRL